MAGLMLYRKTGEGFIINDEIRVHVLKIKGSSGVRLRILAPDCIRIIREEVYEKTNKQISEDEKITA